MLIREKLVRAEIAAAKAGIREVGGNNHGPWVKKFLAEVGLPEGYAWCDAFQSYEEHAAAGRRLPIESASVWTTLLAAEHLKWVVATPARGDLVLYDFDGNGVANDHIGVVVSAGAYGPLWWKLNTVEGNTGDGSAADGDGVYLRTRIVTRSSVKFVRIPGVIHVDAPVPPPPPAPALPTLQSGGHGPAVKKLQTLLNKHGAKVAVDGVFGKRTEASVRAFQKRHGLTPDGVVGPKTWAKLVPAVKKAA